MTEVVLRDVREGDFASLYALDLEYAERSGRPAPAEEHRRRFWLDTFSDGYERHPVAALRNGTVVGGGWLIFVEHTAAMQGYTATAHRGSGVGTAIVEWALARAREHVDVTDISIAGYLEDDAIDLLTSCGFDQIAPPQWDMFRDGVVVPLDDTIEIEVDDSRARYEQAYIAAFSAGEYGGWSADLDDTFDEFAAFGTRDGETIGFCHGSLRKDRAAGTVMFLGVHPDHRRGGVGRALLRFCGNELVQRGAKTLHLTVDTSNERALDLYRSEGYTVRSVLRSYGRPL